MAGEKDPFRAAEAQAKAQQAEREQAPEQPQGEQQQPTTADYERYDEKVGDEVKGIGGASASGPAV